VELQNERYTGQLVERLNDAAHLEDRTVLA
jgi:hypothetical protein